LPLSDELLDVFIANRSHWCSEGRKSISNFTPEQFTLLLCGWYEVKPKYEVGDWIFRFGNVSVITKIETLKDNRIKIYAEGYDGWLYEDECRKATEEEIAEEKKRSFWWKLGRKVNQYKKYDIAKCGVHYGTVQGIEASGKVRFMMFEGYSVIELCKEELDMVCPEENRKDLKEMPF